MALNVQANNLALHSVSSFLKEKMYMYIAFPNATNVEHNIMRLLWAVDSTLRLEKVIVTKSPH